MNKKKLKNRPKPQTDYFSMVERGMERQLKPYVQQQIQEYHAKLHGELIGLFTQTNLRLQVFEEWLKENGETDETIRNRLYRAEDAGLGLLEVDRPAKAGDSIRALVSYTNNGVEMEDPIRINNLADGSNGFDLDEAVEKELIGKSKGEVVETNLNIGNTPNPIKITIQRVSSKEQ